MDSKLIHDRLVEVRGLIDTPEKWEQGTWARDADGNPTHATRPEACAFCISGAVLRVVGDGMHATLIDFISKANGGIERFPGVWNDAEGRTHAEVLAALDCAIATAIDFDRS